MTDPARPVRVAIIGAGNIAEVAHMPAIHAQDGQAQVVAVVDVDFNRASGFAERWQIPAVFSDLQRMLAQCAPDLAIVCTPPIGRLGKPLIGICHTLWYRDEAYYQVPWRGKWSTEGGGPTMGHGIHALARADTTHLDNARVSRIPAPPETTLGMCGFLHAYDPVRR